jgi:Uma2 family endonuclease
MPLAKPKVQTETDYYNLPENVRAELIDGTLVYNQAAPSRIHQTILMELSGTIRQYIKSKGGSCHVYPAPFAVKLREDRKTIVEPDISVICDQSKLTERGCTGAPDWIIEITSPSNSNHDYILKLNLYADAGVKEYWIVDPAKASVFVYCLEQGHFMADAYTFQDKIKVNIYEDLFIDFSTFDLK